MHVLMGVIARLGRADNDSWSVNFGTLFLAYQDISDAVGRGGGRGGMQGWWWTWGPQHGCLVVEV